MIVSFGGPCYEDLVLQVGARECSGGVKPTMPKANTAPSPKTMP